MRAGTSASPMSWATAALLLPALLGWAASARPAATVEGPGTSAAPGLTGTIEGRVLLKLPPPRRAAARYPGRGAAAGQEVQAIPAVVYLVGPSSPPAAEPLSMAQQDTTFVPGVLVVPVGTTVDFPNRDPFFHNVFSYSSPARFDLGRYPRGESKSVTFEEAGVVKVYCEVHESMRAAVLVVENRHHAVVAEDGSFTLSGAPAGTWTLVAWHADLGSTETEVTVPSAGSVRVELELGG